MADKGKDFAVFNGKIDIFEGDFITVFFGDVFDLDHDSP
jgi:hypothetical protein